MFIFCHCELYTILIMQRRDPSSVRYYYNKVVSNCLSLQRRCATLSRALIAVKPFLKVIEVRVRKSPPLFYSYIVWARIAT